MLTELRIKSGPEMECETEQNAGWMLTGRRAERILTSMRAKTQGKNNMCQRDIVANQTSASVVCFVECPIDFIVVISESATIVSEIVVIEFGSLIGILIHEKNAQAILTRS